VDITGVAVVLTVSDQNVLSICSQSANFCGSLDWEPEHNFERSQRNKRGETLQPKGK